MRTYVAFLQGTNQQIEAAIEVANHEGWAVRQMHPSAWNRPNGFVTEWMVVFEASKP